MFSNRMQLSFYLGLCLAGTAPTVLAQARAHDSRAEASPTRDSAAAPSDSLTNLVGEALRNNPGLKAAAFQVTALHSSPGHAWYLDAPEIGVQFYQTPVRSFPNPLKNQQEIDYSIQQALPFPGKIASRIDAEHRHAEMTEADFAGRRRRMIRDIKTAYYELWLLDRRLEINRENQTLMGRLVEIARRQYEVGLGRQADILRAQTEATNLKADSISLLQVRRAAEGSLNALLARRIDRPIQVTDTLTPSAADWSFGQIRPILEKSHPDLQAMKGGIRMREAGVTVARKELLPDFTVGAAYKDMLRMPPGTQGAEPQDYWSVSASMNVPLALWSLPKYRAGVAQSAAYLSRAEMEYADAANMVFARAQGALLKAGSNAELLRVSRDILLPQAQQALESNLTAYQGGKGEFMGLLDAYRVRLMARQNSEMALMQVLTSQAELEEAVGLSLEEIQAEVNKGTEK